LGSVVVIDLGLLIRFGSRFPFIKGRVVIKNTPVGQNGSWNKKEKQKKDDMDFSHFSFSKNILYYPTNAGLNQCLFPMSRSIIGLPEELSLSLLPNLSFLVKIGVS